MTFFLLQATQPVAGVSSPTPAWIAIVTVSIAGASLCTAIASVWVARKQAAIAADQKEIATKQLAISETQREIAKGNLKIAADKLRRDLWDDRKKIYDRAWKFLDLITTKPATREEYVEFRQQTANAEFLFDPPLVKYLEKLGTDALQHRLAQDVLISSHSKLREGTTPEHDAIIEREHKAQVAVTDHYVSMAKQFRPYFYFENVTTEAAKIG